MKKCVSIFFSGLKYFLPLVITLLVVVWVIAGLEGLFKWVLHFFIGSSYDFPGLGWLAAILFTFLFGLLIQVPTLRKWMDRWMKLFLQLPIISTLHNMSSDIMMFLTKKGMRQGQIVKIHTPLGDVLGILTREDLSELPDGVGNEDQVAVFISMSYNLGGYTFLVPKKDVEPLDLSVEKGLALAMTAYISGKKDE